MNKSQRYLILTGVCYIFANNYSCNVFSRIGLYEAHATPNTVRSEQKKLVKNSLGRITENQNHGKCSYIDRENNLIVNFQRNALIYSFDVLVQCCVPSSTTNTSAKQKFSLSPTLTQPDAQL